MAPVVNPFIKAGDNDSDGEIIEDGSDKQLTVIPFQIDKCRDIVSGGDVGDKELNVVSMTHVCQECGKDYSSRKSLLRHERGHRNMGPYKCCGQSFPVRDVDHFRRHRASKHQGPKSYPCTYCGKSFVTQHEAKAHERREENPAMHMCDTCNMFFPRQFQLQEHMATHSSEHKYMCNCGKIYKHKSSLSRHRKCHTKN
ncbi:zinc finger protein 8-like [Mercenaria mercenaria]|uniref:zinc finger protein 8-like n=1 Tax=Mercenaria mercenaria TaxID=6596 RepID=UPI00234FA0B2|nr:zinc finger protein 8-like [Mercenaria mercenaria]